MDYKIRTNCAICGTKNLLTVMDYGEVPLAGDFPLAPNDVEKFSFKIKFCQVCFLLQTDSIIDANRLFKNYRYMSSVGLSKHFTSVAQLLKDYFSLDKSSKILEIGSNDGVLLKPMMDLGLRPIGIEPATNIFNIAKEKGCNVINQYFNEGIVEELGWPGKFDLIISNNCFAHIDNINSITSGIQKSLKPEGYLVIEVHYVKPLIESLQYDNIYHEHMYYYSLYALHNLFYRHNMTIVDFEEIPVHAGSLRVYVKNSFEDLNSKVSSKIEEELELGLTDFSYFEKFSDDSKNHILQTKKYINDLVGKGFKVAGYGVSGRANVLCNLCEFNSDIISYVVDESPERSGRYIASTDIKIVDKNFLKENPVDYILIFAWNFSKMIIDKLQDLDCVFLVPFPEMQSIKNSSELKNFVGL